MGPSIPAWIRTAALAGTVLGLASMVPTSAFGAIVFEASRMLTRESVRVPPRDHAAYTYALVGGAELVFFLRSERWRRDPLRIWLVDEPNYGRLEAGRPFEYYDSGSGLADRSAHFVFDVPATDRYYVILDNRQANAPRDLAVYIYARTSEVSAHERETKRLYEEYYRNVRALFDFEDFDIVIARCGSEDAFYQGSIVICRELDELLASSAPRGVRLFILMHEIAHRLLHVWGYQTTYHRQPLADRFAATLIELMDRGESAEQAAQWFAAHKSFVDESPSAASFSMSGARARRIANWLAGSKEIDRWWTKRIVLPRMRTSALEAVLVTHELRPRTRRRIERELKARLSE